MIRWARELVVDRTVLVYAPPLRERIGPRLGPVRLFGDLDELLGSSLARLAPMVGGKAPDEAPRPAKDRRACGSSPRAD